MTLTAPGGISNSSSKPFSNLFGRIAMNNYNIVMESQNSYNYYTMKKTKHYTSSNKYPKPKSVLEVLVGTRLIH